MTRQLVSTCTGFRKGGVNRGSKSRSRTEIREKAAVTVKKQLFQDGVDFGTGSPFSRARLKV